jgi:hypothetical protein
MYNLHAPSPPPHTDFFKNGEIAEETGKTTERSDGKNALGQGAGRKNAPNLQGVLAQNKN